MYAHSFVLDDATLQSLRYTVKEQRQHDLLGHPIYYVPPPLLHDNGNERIDDYKRKHADFLRKDEVRKIKNREEAIDTVNKWEDELRVAFNQIIGKEIIKKKNTKGKTSSKGKGEESKKTDKSKENLKDQSKENSKEEPQDRKDRGRDRDRDRASRKEYEGLGRVRALGPPVCAYPIGYSLRVPPRAKTCVPRDTTQYNHYTFYAYPGQSFPDKEDVEANQPPRPTGFCKYCIPECECQEEDCQNVLPGCQCEDCPVTAQVLQQRADYEEHLAELARAHEAEKRRRRKKKCHSADDLTSMSKTTQFKMLVPVNLPYNGAASVAPSMAPSMAPMGRDKSFEQPRPTLNVPDSARANQAFKFKNLQPMPSVGYPFRNTDKTYELS